MKEGWGFVYSSAKEQKNIDAVFQRALELVVEAERKKAQERQQQKQTKLKQSSDIKKAKKKGCC